MATSKKPRKKYVSKVPQGYRRVSSPMFKMDESASFNIQIRAFLALDDVRHGRRVPGALTILSMRAHYLKFISEDFNETDLLKDIFEKGYEAVKAVVARLVASDVMSATEEEIERLEQLVEASYAAEVQSTRVRSMHGFIYADKKMGQDPAFNFSLFHHQ